MNKDILVSVFCCAYNHEKYIRKCIENILNQKTNFKFELIINDDASTDNTAKIIKEYITFYPNIIIKPFLQEENLYSKHISIYSNIMIPNAEGKYIAICEGDDYWCDEYKLQTQVDILEKEKDCHACFHKVQVISENGENLSSTYPTKDIISGKIAQVEFMKHIIKYDFHTSSYMLNAEEYKKYFIENPLYKQQIFGVADTPSLLYFASLGEVFYYNKIMSCYRSQSIGSWNSRYRMASIEKKIEQKENMKKMYMEYDKYTNYLFHDLITEQIVSYSYQQELIKGEYYNCLNKCYRNIYLAENNRTKLSILLRGIKQLIKRKLFNM